MSGDAEGRTEVKATQTEVKASLAAVDEALSETRDAQRRQRLEAAKADLEAALRELRTDEGQTETRVTIPRLGDELSPSKRPDDAPDGYHIAH